jgi:hypothetical protein
MQNDEVSSAPPKPLVEEDGARERQAGFAYSA